MGLARVRVAGQSAKILKEGWEELAWGVELSTEGNAKLGPTTLDIHPGYEDEVEKEKYICFGKGFQGCDFPASALNTGQLHLSKECQIGSGEASEDGSIVMSATSADGGAGTVVYSRFVGSGGVSNSIEVTTMTPEEYCEKNKGHH
jgi:hypothetical protein